MLYYKQYGLVGILEINIKKEINMKNVVFSMIAVMAIVGCGGGGDTHVDPTPVVVEGSNINVEPTPVEVVVINGEEEATPTKLFSGVRDSYRVYTDSIDSTVTMLINDEINLFNFMFVIELEDGDLYYSEPNVEKEDGRITVTDSFKTTNIGRYTISLFYYGKDNVQLTKKTIDN
jgi:hypothetical protein